MARPAFSSDGSTWTSGGGDVYTRKGRTGAWVPSTGKSAHVGPAWPACTLNSCLLPLPGWTRAEPVSMVPVPKPAALPAKTLKTLKPPKTLKTLKP